MKKYKVTQEFMDALNKWNDSHKFPDGTTLINQYTLDELPEDVTYWLFPFPPNADEGNKRLGAIINWINGEDVFEIGTPKYVVRRNEINAPYGREYVIITTNNCFEISYYIDSATRFDDFEEASEWANKHFEVVEVDE